jgi:hypothetical protein
MSVVSPLSAPPTPHPSVDEPARVLAWAGYGAFTLSAVLLVLLHLVPGWGGDVSPVTAMLSEYAYTPGRWMWALALATTAAGSAAVAIALRRTGVLPDRLSTTWLVLWCVTILAVAIFRKDPQGGAITLTGKVHLYATSISCGALPVTGLLLARRHRTHPHWYRFAIPARRLAIGSIPFFLPFIVPFTLNVLLHAHIPTPATGLIERLMGLLELALLALLAAWGHHAASHPATRDTIGRRPQSVALPPAGHVVTAAFGEARDGSAQV